MIVAGLEPITEVDDAELAATGVSVVGSEWCTNLDCPSNGSAARISSACGQTMGRGARSAAFRTMLDQPQMA